MKLMVGPFFLLCLILGNAQTTVDNPVFEMERDRVLERAKRYQDVGPFTVSASICERSAGGKNYFYSEGDYWWPDPENPDGPNPTDIPFLIWMR